MPVHKWLLRTIYFPAMNHGVNRSAGTAATLFAAHIAAGLHAIGVVLISVVRTHAGAVKRADRPCVCGRACVCVCELNRAASVPNHCAYACTCVRARMILCSPQASWSQAVRVHHAWPSCQCCVDHMGCITNLHIKLSFSHSRADQRCVVKRTLWQRVSRHENE